MSIKRKIISILCLLMVFSCTNPQIVYAAAKQSEIVTLETQQDLAVMFTFDKEVVDIVFISPSGTRKSVNDSDVECSTGNLWSTYRISDAEAGSWSVEYDLKSNSEINYSIIEDNYGLWIQYFNIVENAGDKTRFTFEADCEVETINYEYEIYAISTTDETAINKVAYGSARSNEEIEAEITLSSLSSDSYVFRLDVYYRDGEAELFDSVISESLEYNNPNEPISIDDYKVLIDLDNLSCEIDWSDYSNWGYESYRVVIEEDGEEIYSGDFESNTHSTGVVFSAAAKELQLKLYYKNNGIWSDPKIKKISLEEEYLKITSDDVTSSEQVSFEYQVKSDRLLYVKVNDDEGNYKIKDSGNLSFALEEGENDVYAEMECDNLIYFIVDSNIYYDTNPPSIKIYDNLDGKTFYNNEINILGMVLGSNELKINGETVSFADSGEFSYLLNLSLGENVVEIEAFDVNGNSSKMVLTLYKASKIVNGDDSKSGWIQFLPLVASLLTSILVILLAFLFMHKKEKVNGVKKYKVWPWIAWDLLLICMEVASIWQFVTRYAYSNSMNFLELAEKSASDAARYLRLVKFFGMTSLTCIILLVISVIITALVIKKKVRDEMKEGQE